MQFNDLQRQYTAYQSEIDEAIQKVLRSSQFINGEEVGLLEQELAEYVGVKHAISCASGTDALLLCLMALDLQPGEEIICPAFSFISPASMTRLLSATPVFVDVSPLDFNIDIEKLEGKITTRTKAIIGVSLFGQCADFDPIKELAAKHGLWTIEDGAQSFGATYKGDKSGSLTDLAITSFFPAKPLGCYGDGGAIFTNNDVLAEKLRVLKSHGQTSRYYHQLVGLNSRLDTIQAAILRVKLKHLDDELQARGQVAATYKTLLPEGIFLPEVVNRRESSWAQFTVGLGNRDQAKEYLAAKGIPTTIHYPLPLPMQDAFADIVAPGESFEVASLLSEAVLSLPMHAFLSIEEIQYIAQSLKEFMEHES
ncbi:DegT/DnrJ/EryC1/StrS family aminotransferase [Mangrovibacterium diazotrophicum]|uniref:UDP-2-acetamido-2-deoxy-ribo-hexuluronate aminotransferase n=1 Tax=Mangrovibacterium diazotrophicum TaxID=1261403 RepID=A0A419WAT3_9BACT|nr:DegT/DnrJ/EryC1/StrS family aminotransferase [Mangrovibacterium diazotrophicum]RKD92578.1 UDP-2-acetamido-2-deoxy-ribo-hexuluronate aminotransferase [Mangrovibacterium diazotrophicum]